MVVQSHAFPMCSTPACSQPARMRSQPDRKFDFDAMQQGCETPHIPCMSITRAIMRACSLLGTQKEFTGQTDGTVKQFS
jgi:hypothetical protein